MHVQRAHQRLLGVDDEKLVYLVALHDLAKRGGIANPGAQLMARGDLVEALNAVGEDPTSGPLRRARRTSGGTPGPG